MFTEKLTYKVSTSSKDFNREIVINKIDNGFLLKTLTENKDEMEYYTDPLFSVVKWKYYNPDNSIDITAERYGNLVTVTGRFKNKKHEEKLKIDDLPWCQEMVLGLKSFIVSDKKTKQFWLMNPQDLKISKFEVNKESIETIEVNGEKVESIYVKMSLAGFLKIFWSGNIWFRKSDGAYVFSRMKIGPPNIPVTTVELIEEKQNKENVI